MKVDLSAELLSPVEQQKRRPRHDMITLDESWFHFCMDHQLMWLGPGEKIPESGRNMIQSAKMMVTIS
jgi:hypothetical protein